MTTLADAKLAALQTLTGSTGAVQDLEQAYLLLLITGTPKGNTVYDLWDTVFDEASIAAGQFNDRMFAYVTTIVAPSTFDGYNERLQEYWENGGTPLGPVGPQPPELQDLQHHFDFTDPTQVFSDVGGTTQAVNGSSIRRVNNKGTDGQPLIDAGTVPALHTNQVNGLQVAENTLLAQALTTVMTNGPNAGSITFAIAVRVNDNSVTQEPFNWTDGVSRDQSVIADGAGSGDWLVEYDGANANTNKAVEDNEWVWVIGSITGAFADQEASGAPPTGGLIGYSPVGSGEPLSLAGIVGQVGELLIYDSKLSTIERALLVDYFDAKYGVMPFFEVPVTVSALIHHYDFTDNAQVFKNLPGTQLAIDGDPIRLITDKGDNPANLTSASTANSPTYRTNFAPIGQNVADFSPGVLSKPMTGTDGPGQLGVSGMSNALIFRLTDPLGPAVQMADWGFGVGRLRILRDFGGGFMLYDYPGAVGGFSTGVITPGAWYLWYASVTGTALGPDDRFRLSGEAQQMPFLAVAADIAPGEPITLTHLTAQNFQIAEWAVWGGPLTDPELVALEAYVLAKYGVLPTAPAAPLAHWDFTDIDTLFTDVARTTPVTVDGDEIKGVTDKGRAGMHLEVQGTNGPRFTTAGINGLSTADFDDTNAESLISVIAQMLDDSNSFPEADYNFVVIGEFDAAAAGPQAGRAFNWPSQVMSVIALPSPPAAMIIVRVNTLDDEVDQEANTGGNFAAWGEVIGNDGEASINKTAGKNTVNDFPPSLSSVKPTIGGGTGTGVEWHGFVSEIIVWDSADFLPSQAAIEQYVTVKYGLTWA